MTSKQKKRQARIIEDLTYLIKTEKSKWGGGNKDLIKQFDKTILLSRRTIKIFID